MSTTATLTRNPQSGQTSKKKPATAQIPEMVMMATKVAVYYCVRDRARIDPLPAIRDGDDIWRIQLIKGSRKAVVRVEYNEAALHRPRRILNQLLSMNSSAKAQLDSADLNVKLANNARKLGPNDHGVIKKREEHKSELVATYEETLKQIAEWEKVIEDLTRPSDRFEFDFSELVPEVTHAAV